MFLRVQDNVLGVMLIYVKVVYVIALPITDRLAYTEWQCVLVYPHRKVVPFSRRKLSTLYKEGTPQPSYALQRRHVIDFHSRTMHKERDRIVLERRHEALDCKHRIEEQLTFFSCTAVKRSLTKKKKKKEKRRNFIFFSKNSAPQPKYHDPTLPALVE